MKKLNEFGHQEIYRWKATLKSGDSIPSQSKLYKVCDLPFEDVVSFSLVPMVDGYAPIRVNTGMQPFHYFRRIIVDNFMDIVNVFYVIQTFEKIYVVQYPKCRYFTLDRLEELDAISW